MPLNKVVLITGAAKRIGAFVVRFLHAKGFNIVLHYHSSEQEAEAIYEELSKIRAHSIFLVKADLNDIQACNILIEKTIEYFGRLDVLINNASSFFPTPIGTVNLEQWNDLFCSNLRAPFFITQKAAPFLSQTKGCIINMVDIHAAQPLRNYSVYCSAKAGLMMLTKAFAKELGPLVRVNGVAPGAILWPEQENVLDTFQQAKIIQKTALQRKGIPEDIAKAIYYFIEEAPYVTGQILAIDGGRSI